MAKAKVAVTIDEKILLEVDRLVTRRIFPNRSKAIEEAVQEKLDRLSHARLARECAKLDPELEKALAEEGMQAELDQWPEYKEVTSVGPILTLCAGASREGCGRSSY